ncbi:S-layer homology domain-containing protein [Tindallia californiensis]|uniref:NlpC/P60 family protein n=1 Tax=Tindallia californiensis TaxID=159292 RepID=A0A1H3R1X6_9FIRM|nr:S-layer homology domain-containing protein [Tindallia californiensis]SDZ19687.1 NlpC/P60 family protein [Tindallia californiensis]
MEKSGIGLVEFAERQLGNPYWWGTFGQIATENLLQRLARQYPAHYPASRMSRYRQGFGKRVFDCNGMVKGYLWTLPGGQLQYDATTDWNANGTLKRCAEKGPINTIPDEPGVLVFFPGHVGVYEGNGNVIEARGFNHGVVRRPLSAGRWHSWGKHPHIDYSIEGMIEHMKSKYFKDIKQQWQADHVDPLKEKGIISGRTETTFDPDAPITRAECAVLIKKTIDYLERGGR